MLSIVNGINKGFTPPHPTQPGIKSLLTYCLPKRLLSFFIFAFIFIFLSPLFLDSISSFSYVSSLFNDVGRIDLYFENSSENNSKIEFTRLPEGITVDYPDWMKQPKVMVATLTIKEALTSWTDYSFTIKSTSDCSIKVDFLGPDRRTNNTKVRFPVVVSYKEIAINNNVINSNRVNVYHDKRYNKVIQLRKGKGVTLSFKIKGTFPSFDDFSKPPEFSYTAFIIVLLFSLILGSSIGNTYSWKNSSIKSNNRNSYYDFLRIFAIFFVIYNHSSGFHLYLGYKMVGFEEFLHICLSVFDKIAVPMFFMISGALLLGKTESIKTVLLKRVSRVVLVLIFFTLLTMYMRFICYKEVYDTETIVRGLLQGGLPDAYPYWFLYAYLGFLVVLPFLRKIAQNIETRDIILIICLVFLFNTFLPTFNLVLAHFKIAPIRFQAHFSFIASYFVNLTVFCTLTGYYFDKINVAKITAKCCILLSLLIVVGILFSAIATICEKNLNGKFTQNYMLCCSELFVIPIFVLVKKFFSSGKVPKLVQHLAITVGPLIFLVYLEDLPLRYLIYPNYLYTKFNVWQYPVIQSIGWCVISIVVSGSFAFILRKSSFVRKYL